MLTTTDSIHAKTGYFTHDGVDNLAPRIELTQVPDDVDPRLYDASEPMLSPECPERLSTIENLMMATGLDERVFRVLADPAPLEWVQLAHTPEYIERLRLASLGDKAALASFTEVDTPVTETTYSMALKSAGCVLAAIDALYQGEIFNGFCAVRPPGHHAGPSQARGFCYFNNVAIGALYAQRRYKAERIAVIDFDVHHGDGTEEILEGHPGIKFFSLFQWPLYPSVLNPECARNIFRLKVPAGSTGSDVLQQIHDAWDPVLEEYQPDLILCSAGFDAHTEEPMAQLKWNEADFAAMTRYLLDWANKSANGRLISVLEGGYSLRSLARSVVSHLNTLVRYAEEARR